MGKFELEDFGTWPFIGGVSALDLLGQWTVHFLKDPGVPSSGYVLVFGSLCVCLCVGSEVGGGETLFPGAAEGQSSLFGACSVCMICVFGLLSLKNNSLSC